MSLFSQRRLGISSKCHVKLGSGIPKRKITWGLILLAQNWTAWVQITAVPLTNWMTLGSRQKLSELQFSCLCHNKSIYLFQYLSMKKMTSILSSASFNYAECLMISHWILSQRSWASDLHGGSMCRDNSGRLKTVRHMHPSDSDFKPFWQIGEQGWSQPINLSNFCMTGGKA